MMLSYVRASGGRTPEEGQGSQHTIVTITLTMTITLTVTIYIHYY